MVFKRRDPRSYGQMATEFVYPRGGWRRAGQYVLHRLRRLPDPPHRIGRGVAAGVFVSFTPLFGIHFLGAIALAWVMGGNIFAALLATFVGNPLTTPFIAVLSVSLGRWLLGVEGDIGPQEIVAEIAAATGEVGHNVLTAFTREAADWTHLEAFFADIFLPYLVGGIIPGLIAATLGHYLTLPVVRAYQKRREEKAEARLARARAAIARAEAADDPDRPG